MADAINHSFLLKEGLWRSEGEFVDGAGKRVAVVGDAHIRHHPDKWVYEGVLRAATVPPTEHRTVYDIQPMAPGNFATPWTSKSAAFVHQGSGSTAMPIARPTRMLPTSRPWAGFAPGAPPSGNRRTSISARVPSMETL